MFRAWSTKYEARTVFPAPGMAYIHSTEESEPNFEFFHDWNNGFGSIHLQVPGWRTERASSKSCSK